MRKTEESIQELEGIVEKEDITDADNLNELAHLDIQFHSSLYKMSANNSLRTFQNLLNTLFTIYYRSRTWRKRQIISHTTLIGILKKGTRDAFRTAKRLHLNTGFEDMETWVKNQSTIINLNKQAKLKSKKLSIFSMQILQSKGIGIME